MDAIIGTGKISKREYGIIAERNISVMMSDGVNIDVDIFRPDSGKKFPVLLCLAPFNKDSGAKKGKRKIFGGRAAIRAPLYMAAMSAAKHNPVIKPFYQSLIKRGKLEKVAFTACMRKLLVIANALVRKGEAWQFSPQ